MKYRIATCALLGLLGMEFILALLGHWRVRARIAGAMSALGQKRAFAITRSSGHGNDRSCVCNKGFTAGAYTRPGRNIGRYRGGVGRRPAKLARPV